MATAQKLLIRSITPDHLNRAAEVIRLLGHAERLKILEVLERGEASVTDIQEALDLPQAIVSQHLAKMRWRRAATGNTCTTTSSSPKWGTC